MQFRPQFLLLALCCALALRPVSAFEPLPLTSMDDARHFHIEVLQVTSIEPYQQSYEGFALALKEQGLVQDKNLSVHRVAIDFDAERGGFWTRLAVLLRIQQETARIVAAKPDLVLTIGTPATKYARGRLAEAKIPVVFTAVANPEDAGCPSLVRGGEGVTGATLYTDMPDTLKLLKTVFPAARRIGMVHTDDENGVANVASAVSGAAAQGLTILPRQVDKNDAILPALEALRRAPAEVELLAVPLDTYYGLHQYEAARRLGEFGAAHGLPVVSLAMVQVPGAALYVGAEFEQIGRLAGLQASQILRRHVLPEQLPIARPARPTVLVDPARLAALHVELPSGATVQPHLPADGYWQLTLPIAGD